jgi:hypothetical protein
MNDTNGSCLLLRWQSDLCSVLNLTGAAALKLCRILRQKTFSLWKTLENVGKRWKTLENVGKRWRTENVGENVGERWRTLLADFFNCCAMIPRADMLRWDRPSTDDERLTMIREPRTDLSVRPEKD